MPFTFNFASVRLIPFASLCSSKNLEQPGRFRLIVDKVRTTFYLFRPGKTED
jgi:hypothetical protein